jgi:hypothetical protein
MSADTLTASGAAIDLGPPSADENGHASTFLSYAAEPTGDEIVTLTASGYSAQYQGATEITATGYDLSGNVTFRTALWDNNAANPVGAVAPTMTLLANGNVAVAWNQQNGLSEAGDDHNDYAVVSPSGALVNSGTLGTTGGAYFPIQGYPTLYAIGAGFTLAWNAQTQPFGASPSNPAKYALQVQPLDTAGHLIGPGTSSPEPSYSQTAPSMGPHAVAAAASGILQMTDNQVQFYDGMTLHQAVTIPGEPAHAITSEAAAMLANGDVAVAWVDSGTDYVALFDASTNGFVPSIGLDWGGASDIHVVALPDGGFAVSWMNGGAYKGELFDSAGNGGGTLFLAGDVAGIASNGDLYTVAPNASGQYVIQDYAISGSGGGGTAGQTFTSDDNGGHWVGTAANDTFNLGRGGDVVTGNGGNDTYNFAAIPWAGGHITDFNAGDVLNLTGLMSTTTDTGTDGFADGYLKITDDGTGNAQVWANYHLSGNDDWWLAETLDGVAPGRLTHTGAVITVESSSGGGGTAGQTFTSDDNGDTWVGTSGNDTFHLGRGGDTVTGGAGADTFAYPAIPWAGGHITDFNAAEGDKIDVSGLLSQAKYTGADPIADGFLKFDTDGGGNAQVWADYNVPGNDGWWLVATLDGVSTSSLHYSGGLIT